MMELKTELIEEGYGKFWTTAKVDCPQCKQTIKFKYNTKTGKTRTKWGPFGGSNARVSSDATIRCFKCGCEFKVGEETER